MIRANQINIGDNYSSSMNSAYGYPVSEGDYVSESRSETMSESHLHIWCVAHEIWAGYLECFFFKFRIEL